MSFIKNDTGYKNGKYAIFFLCYLNDHYVIGLLETLYAHRKLLGKDNDIELVVMCDEYISNFKDEIIKYADRVVTINMDRLNGHMDVYGIKKYAMQWIEYIHNKWHCLYFDEYKKILFLDIDTLPVNKKLYNIFTNYKEDIIFSGRAIASSGCLKSVYYNEASISKYSSYEEYNKYNKTHVDASYMLLPPSKKLHDEYYSYMKTIDPLDASLISTGLNASTIDEKSILYYLTSKTNITFNFFKKDDDFAVPWKKAYLCDNLDTVKYKSNNLNIFNYRSQIKPYLMPLEFLHAESYIWKLIEKNIVSKSKLIKALSIRNALYSYLLSKVESYMAPVDDISKSNVGRMVQLLDKNGLTLENPIFNKQSYNALIKSFDLLFSYIKPINDNYEIYNKCCGLINKNIVRDIID